MTDPFDTPTGRWGLIFHGSGLYRRSHTRQEWREIADAIATADLARPDSVGTRGDDAWCQVAVDVYTRLHEMAAYTLPRPDDEPLWSADEHLIRAWLDAPVVPPADEPATTLDAHGFRDAFDPRGIPDPADLSILVDLAQDAGVVGAPHQKVSLLRWVDDGVFRDDAFLVLLWPPDGPARASTAVGLDDLLPPASSPVDRIVRVLRGVSAVANRLLSATGPAASTTDRQRDQAPESLPLPAAGPRHDPVGRRGHPFQVINGGASATGASAPPPPSPRQSPPPRRPRT